MNQQEIANTFELGTVQDTARLNGGKVNVSYDVTTNEGRFVFQNLSDIFDEEIITDYRQVQRFLRTSGVTVPVLMQTPTGEYHVTNEHGFWRVFEYMENDPILDTSPEIAFEAGKMLGQFHEVMKQSPVQPTSKIPHFHDTEWYVQRLKEVYAEGIEKQEATRESYKSIMKRPELHEIDDNTKITLHGDPKYANMLFKDKKVIAILDLDTMMQGSPLLDIGDGLRSWAKNNDSEFDPTCFRRGVAGYLSETDCKYDVADCKNAMRVITLELATRYLTDAFEEKYFTWDPTKYASAYEHNLERAQRTLKFLEDIE
jgi:Ser/Thr protein kinase RdoA (MazF antagonist)